MRAFWRLSAAGFAASSITYGPARMGFGLFVPEFRNAFSLPTEFVGIISSLGFLGFFFGLIISQIMTNRKGPRLPIIIGLFSATVGTAIIALAPNLPILSLGAFLAMASAGFSWSPFNNVVHRQVQEKQRPAVLSIVSTGTASGIAFAGMAALLVGLGDVSWRLCWVTFSIASALSLLYNWITLRDVAGTPGPSGAQPQWINIIRSSTVPLFSIALCFGATSAIYISFAADAIVQSGGLPGLSSRSSAGLIFIFFGLFGLLGIYTGKIKALIGLTWFLRLLMLSAALSLALIALMPNSVIAVSLSAGLQGIHVMMISSVFAFWSDRLFPYLPSQSFTVVLLAVAIGSVFGPICAGFIYNFIGVSAMFLGTAALPAIIAITIQRKNIREHPFEW